MWGKIFSLLSNPREKPGSPEMGQRMMKELETKLLAKEMICDRCRDPLSPEEKKNPRIIINFFENWLLCRKCR